MFDAKNRYASGNVYAVANNRQSLIGDDAW